MNRRGVVEVIALALALTALGRGRAALAVGNRGPVETRRTVQFDSDRDGIPDRLEDRNSNGRLDPGESDPRSRDTDGDGIADGVEDANRNGRIDRGESDPRSADSDRDGIPDGIEDANQNGRLDPGETSPTSRCTSAWAGRPCAIGADVDAPHRGPRVPEPIVFDLVRGLGARRGEVEVNVLGVLALPVSGPALAVAPEIEYAFADDWAVEIELPFVGTHLDALKVALQGTFGVAANGRFVHGVQFVSEPAIDLRSLRNTALYIAGLRFNRAWSAMLMVGVAGTFYGSSAAPEVELLVHPSLFAEVSARFLFGVESNLRFFSAGGVDALVLPHVRWRISNNFVAQAGGGLHARGETFSPALALRLSAEF